MVDLEGMLEDGSVCAVILAGSGSDEEHIDKLVGELNKYEVLSRVHIASAHKQGSRVEEVVKEYDRVNGNIVYVCVAGGTDALSGTVSWLTNRPTISSPPDGWNESCLRNPPGSSNATFFNYKNAARFVAQVGTTTNPKYGVILDGLREGKLESLRGATAKLEGRYNMGE